MEAVDDPLLPKIDHMPDRILIVLTDAPAGVRQTMLVEPDDISDGRITVDYRGRHLHFIATDGLEMVGQPPAVTMAPVYRLSYVTSIAE
ncbi:hypothetical protein NONI108955_23580 [Nocardia ninae]|uniref:Uncharacterized protein n=1 Tax=Nocardia ninae NBRC 108245 TaxID=1210091 RepID=A0A511MH03_9NOCA|nr:hypothetical protein [Nocardia ninae]GEM39944.1 hypothetical protein NN4_44630 [Nocardia ninae NBRC 108245]